jgi:hypothetical protein
MWCPSVDDRCASQAACKKSLIMQPYENTHPLKKIEHLTASDVDNHKHFGYVELGRLQIPDAQPDCCQASKDEGRKLPCAVLNLYFACTDIPRSAKGPHSISPWVVDQICQDKHDFLRFLQNSLHSFDLATQSYMCDSLPKGVRKHPTAAHNWEQLVARCDSVCISSAGQHPRVVPP